MWSSIFVVATILVLKYIETVSILSIVKNYGNVIIGYLLYIYYYIQANTNDIISLQNAGSRFSIKFYA